MSLADELRDNPEAMEPAARPTHGAPLWKGPEVDGITYSLLCKFLEDRERFRLYVCKGLCVGDHFNHRIEFGNLWHICEEAHAGAENRSDPAYRLLGDNLWKARLSDYCGVLSARYPMARADIDKWYEVCLRQFPLYLEHWRQHPEMVYRTALLQEHKFNVLYNLPSGRTVRLRGKWDSVDRIETLKGPEVWLQENKTKGDIDEPSMRRQLTYDMQTMLYLVALTTEQHRLDDSTIKARLSYRDGQYRYYYPIAGVRYNVIRRPLSGGKGTIIRHKGTKNKPEESEEHYYDRMAQYIRDEPETYFMRWNVNISTADIAKFRVESLDPILEQLCAWWDHVSAPPVADNPFALSGGVHYRMPYGVYSRLADGVPTELDEYLISGSTAGLRVTDNLFPELT